MARVPLGLVVALLALCFAQRTPVGPLYGPVPVVHVVDGDTLVVASNVGPRTVRLIGVDAPEMLHPARGREPLGPEADLYADAVAAARADGRGAWAEPAEAHADPGLPPGPIVIACALYNPDTPNDTGGEWVSLLVREPIDTRGYYLRDAGSGATFRLPAGVQEPGELIVRNPGQGVWNNGGDIIYLEVGGAVVDAWDYADRLAPEGVVVCRDGR